MNVGNGSSGMSRKSKRAKALQISVQTKQTVYERDAGRCVTCGNGNGIPNSHYIPRSSGGLGIEQNIVCQCIDCHNKVHFVNQEVADEMLYIMKLHLQSKYDNWNEDDLKWRHSMNYEDNR